MKRRGFLRILAGLGKPAALVGAGLLAAAGGCTRTYFRGSADNEVEGILAEKDTEPIWRIEQFHVYPDPRSRFADPSNPDHPPMPPDDYAAFARSPHPQQPGKAGVGYVRGWGWLDMIKVWDCDNRAQRQAMEAEEARREEAEGGAPAAPDPATGPRRPVAAYFDEPVNAQPPGFLLKMDQAVELGVLNSPTYQTFREQLYETALPVTLQRFNFAFQWAAGEDFVRNWAGALATGGGAFAPRTNSTGGTSTTGSAINSGSANSTATNSNPSSSATSTSTSTGTTSVPSGAASTTGSTVGGGANNWTATGSVSFSKLFVTGALLTFDFVNTSVWNFLPPKSFTSTSTIDLNLTQPLLQGGGRAVTLEPLTQAERNLFYAIRAYARFREQFYLSVALGSSLPSSLTAAAGGSGSSPISTLAALGIASTDVSGGFVGYLSTLYRECDLAADKKLVRDLQRALRIFEGYQEGGIFSPLQVATVRSNLLNAQNTVLNDQQFINNALDQFKLVLGLPANLPLILDDTPARPITRQLDRYYEVIGDSDAAHRGIEGQEELEPGRLRTYLLDAYTRGPVVRGTAFRRTLPALWEAWARMPAAELQERLNRLRRRRREALDRRTDLEAKGGRLPDDEQARLRRDEVDADLGNLEQVLRRYEARPWMALPTEAQRRQARLQLFRLVAYSAELVLVGPRNERMEALEKLWPEPPRAPLCGMDLSTAEVQAAQQAAVQYALTHRWDLMNARAQLVDSWRQLRVTANALMGVFNVQYTLTSSTPPGQAKPLAFSTDRTSTSLALNTQLPLNRLAQRNAYRTALISYQQQRRALMTLEDNIAVQVRFDVRQLQLFAASYKIQQRLIQSQYAQVESALEVITAPVDPSQLQASGATGQATAAALTSQYLGAITGLNNAQTRMYDIWLSYQATRMQLYLDLESLRMDRRGVWVAEAGSEEFSQAPPGDAFRPSYPRLPAPEAGAPESGPPLSELPPPRRLEE